MYIFQNMCIYVQTCPYISKYKYKLLYIYIYIPYIYIYTSIYTCFPIDIYRFIQIRIYSHAMQYLTDCIQSSLPRNPNQTRGYARYSLVLSSGLATLEAKLELCTVISSHGSRHGLHLPLQARWREKQNMPPTGYNCPIFQTSRV